MTKAPYLLAILLFCVLSVHAQPISSPLQNVYQPFDVVHYEADIELAGINSTTIHAAQVDITVQWRERGTYSFPFHLRDLNISAVYVNGKLSSVDTIGTVQSDTFHFRVKPTAVTPDTQVVYRILYSGKATAEYPARSWGGVQKDAQSVYSMGVGFSNNYISAAQHWLACYDHPSDKATFRGTFRVPKGQMAVSNGLLTMVDTTQLQHDVYVWTEQHRCATYLLAFAVGNYATLQLSKDTSLLQVAYVKHTDSAIATKGFKNVYRMTALFERLYGKYPFDKVGYVNTTTGSMEHQSLISFASSLSTNGDTINITAAHELAHQWFGDYVTPEDFRYAWLTESFATYNELVWLEELFGFQRYLTLANSRASQYITTIAKREEYCPLDNFTRSSKVSNYPETIYQKGAVVVAMLRAYINNDTLFYASLRDYLLGHAYGSGTTNQITKAFAEVAGRDIRKYIDQWVIKSGWPKLEVEISTTNGISTTTITQVQQAQFPEWPIFTELPLNVVYVTSGGQEKDTIVYPNEQGTIVLHDAKVLGVNAGTKSRCLAEIVKNTSILTTTTSSRCSISPNPVSDVVTIHQHENNGEEWTVELFDTQGKLCKYALFSSTEAQIPVTDLTNGIYSVRIRTFNGIHTLRVIVQH